MELIPIDARVDWVKSDLFHLTSFHLVLSVVLLEEPDTVKIGSFHVSSAICSCSMLSSE